MYNILIYFSNVEGHCSGSGTIGRGLISAATLLTPLNNNNNNKYIFIAYYVTCP